MIHDKILILGGKIVNIYLTLRFTDIILIHLKNRFDNIKGHGEFFFTNKYNAMKIYDFPLFSFRC